MENIKQRESQWEQILGNSKQERRVRPILISQRGPGFFRYKTENEHFHNSNILNAKIGNNSIFSNSKSISKTFVILPELYLDF